MVLQATSPYHAMEAFLCIQRTLESAGYAIVPYHGNVPSFVSWGWILADPDRSGKASLAQRVAAVGELEIETRYLTPELMHSSLAFGRNRLHSEQTGINSLMRPLLLDLYLHDSWLED